MDKDDEQFLRILRGILKADPSISQDPEKIVRVAKAILEDARPHPLSTRQKRGRVVDMDQGVTATKESRISARKNKTPSRLHTLAQGLGKSIPGIWGTLPEKTRPGLASVHSWLKKRGRPIPRHWAEYLAKELKDPSLLLPASWPHGIS